LAKGECLEMMLKEGLKKCYSPVNLNSYRDAD